MLTLSIDTASDICAAALWQGGEDGELCAQHQQKMARGHGEALFGIVSTVLDQASVKPGDISRFAAIRGPGTFTGLRVGLAVVRGLALALDADAIGITAFELVAASDTQDHPGEGPRIIAIDARRNELYVSVLGGDLEFVEPPLLLTPENAALLIRPGRSMVIGSGAPALVSAAHKAGRDAQARPPARPSAGLLARFAAGCDPVHCPPEPLYIRAPDARLPQAGPLRAKPDD